jgi:hypothetical protein
VASNNPAEDLIEVVGVASILGHYNATTAIKVTIGMLGCERQNGRHYHQTVEERNHYTSVSDCSHAQHFAKRCQKDPISKEKDENYWKQRGPQEVYKSTLWKDTMMKTRSSEKGVERSITTMEWCAVRNTDEVASERSWHGMNPTAKAFEPRRKVVDMSLQSNNKAQIGDSTMVEEKCWRCHQEGHHGQAQAHTRKELCAAF